MKKRFLSRIAQAHVPEVHDGKSKAYNEKRMQAKNNHIPEAEPYLLTYNVTMSASALRDHFATRAVGRGQQVVTVKIPHRAAFDCAPYTAAVIVHSTHL